MWVLPGAGVLLLLAVGLRTSSGEPGPVRSDHRSLTAWKKTATPQARRGKGEVGEGAVQAQVFPKKKLLGQEFLFEILEFWSSCFQAHLLTLHSEQPLSRKNNQVKVT